MWVSPCVPSAVVQLVKARLSVVVSDLNLVCIAISELETKPILLINPDAVLPFAITPQSFQPVSWGRSQIAQCTRLFKLKELSFGDCAN